MIDDIGCSGTTTTSNILSVGRTSLLPFRRVRDDLRPLRYMGYFLNDKDNIIVTLNNDEGIVKRETRL